MSEETLSDKIIYADKLLVGKGAIDIQDVKEFIKKLKEMPEVAGNLKVFWEDVLKRIDKLAGDDLIGGEEK